MTALYNPVFMDHRISLKPADFVTASKNMEEFLLDKIRADVEGRCCSHGYVKPGSTKIIAKSMGQAEHCKFTGVFQFICKVEVQCLFPNADMRVTGKIIKMNKLGAIAVIVDNGEQQEAMRIILPRDLHLGNSEFDGLQENQIINIKLLRSRFQARDPFINTVGLFEGVAT